MKQYQKLFEMDGVKLKFTKGALHAVAQGGAQAQDRRARPARDPRERDARHHVRAAVDAESVNEVIINEEVIDAQQQPLLMYQKEAAEGGEVRK